MINKLKEIYHTVTQKYFIEVYYLPVVKEGEIPVGQGHLYVAYISGKTDLVQKSKDATIFDFILGYQLINKLKKEFGGAGLNFSLVSLGDVAFIDYVTGNG